MNIISIIPARGGSKGIPLKNLKILCGKPLLDYSINASLKSKFVKRTFVSSDHSKILNRAQKLGAEIITRPRNISTDKSTTESSIKHCLNYLKSKENYTPDVIVLLQNTSPLRNVKHIDGAIRFFLKSHLDSVLSGYKSHHFLWKTKNHKLLPVNYNPYARPMRQEFNNQYIENGAIYITKFSSFCKSQCRISGNIGLYEMPEEISIDIDTREDFELVGKMLKKQKQN